MNKLKIFLNIILDVFGCPFMCPKCHSKNIDWYAHSAFSEIDFCKDCGYEWT